MNKLIITAGMIAFALCGSHAQAGKTRAEISMSVVRNLRAVTIPEGLTAANVPTKKTQPVPLKMIQRHAFPPLGSGNK